MDTICPLDMYNARDMWIHCIHLSGHNGHTHKTLSCGIHCWGIVYCAQWTQWTQWTQFTIVCPLSIMYNGHCTVDKVDTMDTERTMDPVYTVDTMDVKWAHWTQCTLDVHNGHWRSIGHNGNTVRPL